MWPRLISPGHMEHVKSVAGQMCFQQEGTLQIRHVVLRAAPRPIANYTADQQQAFDAAATASEQAQAGFESTNLRPAADAAEKAVKGFEAVLGERHPYTIKALGLLGHAQVSVAGKHPLARETLDRAMNLAREVFGDDHPEVAMLWTRMAAARLERNDDLGALRYNERAIAIYADSHGENALITGITGVQAGGAALNAGRLVSAKQHLELALSRLEQAGIRRDAVARGAIPVDELPTVTRRLPPYYWAAFVLSGD